MIFKDMLLALLRRAQTYYLTFGKSAFLSHGSDLHVGKGSRLWAPKSLKIGSGVYIGKEVHIEADCEIGDYCLIANRVAIVGRHDHDFSSVGFPVRYAPWVGSGRVPNTQADERTVIEADVWLGYGAIVLSGVTVGRGAIVAAGSVVTKDIPPYSVSAGVPARVVGQRFADESVVRLHEAAIRNGRFQLSERGYDHCTIRPALKAEGTEE